MNVIFIIGGIGSGKSTVTRYFARQGVPTLDLDVVGHEVLTQRGPKKLLVEAFGPQILDKTGEIDRKALAAQAFATPQATTRLTDITAPFIIDAMKGWVSDHAAKNTPFVVIEVSAFDGDEGPYADLATAIVAVTAPVETRVARARAKGFEEADILDRIARQPQDEERRRWAQYVIENKGDLDDLSRSLDGLMIELEKLAESSSSGDSRPEA